MTVYTLNDFVGGRYGLPYGRPATATNTNVVFTIDCEGADGYTYVNNTNPPGPNDVSITTTGNIVLTGTWQLTNTRSNLGTTSLIVPGTGSYMGISTSASTNLKSGSMSTFIYLDSLPGSTIYFMHWTSDSGYPTLTPTYGWSFGLDSTGHLVGWTRTNTIVDTITSTATLSTGQWYFITFSWYFGKAWLSVNGVVEEGLLRGIDSTQGTTTSLYAKLAGSSSFSGMYLDDPRICNRLDPYFTSNFSVPTQALETFVPESSRTTITAKVLAPDYTTSFQPERLTIPPGISTVVPITTITRATSKASPIIAHIMGTTDVDGVIVPGVGAPGGGGTPRPSVGVMWPRD